MNDWLTSAIQVAASRGIRGRVAATPRLRDVDDGSRTTWTGRGEAVAAATNGPRRSRRRGDDVDEPRRHRRDDAAQVHLVTILARDMLGYRVRTLHRTDSKFSFERLASGAIAMNPEIWGHASTKLEQFRKYVLSEDPCVLTHFNGVTADQKFYAPTYRRPSGHLAPLPTLAFRRRGRRLARQRADAPPSEYPRGIPRRGRDPPPTAAPRRRALRRKSSKKRSSPRGAHAGAGTSSTSTASRATTTTPSCGGAGRRSRRRARSARWRARASRSSARGRRTASRTSRWP